MTINYGKRNLGAGTRAAPGDTLYIPFSFFNDSGASIFDTGMRRGDIKVFKNGHPTARASDSGYFLGDTGTGLYVTNAPPAQPADTGNYTPFQGLYRCGIRLFNNTQDTGFYDAGSMYHVAMTGASVKSGQAVAKVNFFIATFEIEGVRAGTGGSQSLPMARIDTGIATKAVASVSGAVGSVTGAVGSVTGAVGSVTGAVGSVTGAVGSVTGAVGSVTLVSANAIDTGSLTGNLAGLGSHDTGLRQLVNRMDTGLESTTDAIRVTTDKFVFTVANQVDSNIQYVNDVAVAGTGDTGAGDTWRPA